MTHLVTSVIHQYHDMFDNKSDPRVNNWFMMSSPLPTLLICTTYAYLVKVVGPKLMENRKPFGLRKTLILYNAFQTLFSAWIFKEYLMSGWWGNYSFRCQPVDYSRSPLAMRMAETCWWYFFSKFTELFDTMFFVLRKKNQHVSTLHVIHHGIMPFSVWLGLKFTPGGHSTFFALLNAFVHIVMYFYYMIAAMGPQYQKYIWWKKYLTKFQIIQFVLIFAHQFQLLFIECNYPKVIMVWIAIHGVLFLCLFSNFYKTSYAKDDRSKKNGGFCMPVMSFEKDTKNGKLKNGETNGNSINNTYASTEYSKNLKSCYSNGINNGFVSNGKKAV